MRQEFNLRNENSWCSALEFFYFKIITQYCL